MPSTNNNPLELSFQVKINKQFFSLGETIHVEAEVENKGQETFVFQAREGNNDDLFFWINDSEGHYLIGEGSGIRDAPPSRNVIEVQLIPNQKIIKSADFKTEYWSNDHEGPQPAPVGHYTLTAYYGHTKYTIPIEIQ